MYGAWQIITRRESPIFGYINSKAAWKHFWIKFLKWFVIRWILFEDWACDIFGLTHCVLFRTASDPGVWILDKWIWSTEMRGWQSVQPMEVTHGLIWKPSTLKITQQPNTLLNVVLECDSWYLNWQKQVLTHLHGTHELGHSRNDSYQNGVSYSPKAASSFNAARQPCLRISSLNPMAQAGLSISRSLYLRFFKNWRTALSEYTWAVCLDTQRGHLLNPKIYLRHSMVYQTQLATSWKHPSSLVYRVPTLILPFSGNL